MDIDCGTGLLTLEFAKLDYEVVSIEPFKSMLEVAKTSPNAEKVTWIEGDALVLDKDNIKQVDLAIMTAHVAQFLLEDEYFLDYLKSINKSLKNGGYLVFDSRNPQMQPWFNQKIHSDWPNKELPRQMADPKTEKIKYWVELKEIKNNENSQEELVSINELVFITQEEIINFLNQAGFEIENIYGNWDKSEVSDISPEFIFVARK